MKSVIAICGISVLGQVKKSYKTTEIKDECDPKCTHLFS